MDRRCSRADKCKTASDSPPGSRRSAHTCQGKDPDTCCVYRRGSVRSLCSIRIQDGNLRTGYPHSRGGRCTILPRSAPYKLRSVRMGTASRASVFPEEVAPLKMDQVKLWTVRKTNDKAKAHKAQTRSQTVSSLTLLHHALRERVPGVTRHTHAGGRVAHHSAFCIGSARSGTWVSALQVHTCQVTCTFAIAHAFRPTVWRRPRVVG